MSAQLAQELEKNVMEAAHVVQSGQMFPVSDTMSSLRPMILSHRSFPSMVVRMRRADSPSAVA
jgi:hypothetical protein